MDKNKIDNFDATINSSKIVLSARLKPELKQSVLDQAKALDISPSELVENMLANFTQMNSELKILRGEPAGKPDKISNTTSQLTIAYNKLTDDNQHLRNDNNALLKYVNEVKEFLSVFNDNRFTELFEKLKGLKDEIELPNGEILRLQYQTARDVLKGLIYSFTVKKY